MLLLKQLVFLLTQEACMVHINNGAKKVILTVPAKGEIDATVVIGC